MNTVALAQGTHCVVADLQAFISFSLLYAWGCCPAPLCTFHNVALSMGWPMNSSAELFLKPSMSMISVDKDICMNHSPARLVIVAGRPYPLRHRSLASSKWKKEEYEALPLICVVNIWSHRCGPCNWLYQLGTWCSGITSASHAEGPGFNPQCVQCCCAIGSWRQVADY